MQPTFGQRVVRHPQSLWVRKALFQIHLWTGIGLGIYIFVISLSGSAVVFRRELNRALGGGPRWVTMSGIRLTDAQIAAVAGRAFPGYRVTKVWTARRPNVGIDVWMEQGSTKLQHLFDPFTGRDLGPTIPAGIKALDWLVELHDNLLAHETGRLVNGVGAICSVGLSLTGLLIWWPGSRRWRRSLTIKRGVSWRRFNWDLHSAVGFWTFALVFLWAASGVYLVFPHPFSSLVDYLQPPDGNSASLRTGDLALEWLARLHFGRFAGWKMKTAYTILGLAPAVLFVTGTIMWWNRVLRRRLADDPRDDEDTSAAVQLAEGTT